MDRHAADPYAYQWQRCDAAGANCADIAGATGSTYDARAARRRRRHRASSSPRPTRGSDARDLGRDRRRSLRPAGQHRSAGDLRHGARRPDADRDRGTWTGTPPITYAYQWQRCDAAGATAPTSRARPCRPTRSSPADVDHDARRRDRHERRAAARRATSAQTATSSQAAPPVNTASPAVSGTPSDGSDADRRRPARGPARPIDLRLPVAALRRRGTTAPTSPARPARRTTLTPADVGHAIARRRHRDERRRRRDRDLGPERRRGASTRRSTTGTPAVTGTPRDGQTLTADHGTWTGTGPIDFTYQWQRCDAAGTNCADITGATDADLHARRATTSARPCASSSPRQRRRHRGRRRTDLGRSTPRAPVTTTRPDHHGHAGAGADADRDDGTWTGTAPFDFTYQWQRCDADGANCADIAGATGATYDLTAADVGHAIRGRRHRDERRRHDDARPPRRPRPIAAGAARQHAAPPAPTGTAVDGGTLTADPGTWTGTAPITYDVPVAALRRRRHDCADIAGATDETYALDRRRRRPRDRGRRHRDEPRRLEPRRPPRRRPPDRRPRRRSTRPPPTITGTPEPTAAR